MKFVYPREPRIVHDRNIPPSGPQPCPCDAVNSFSEEELEWVLTLFPQNEDEQQEPDSEDGSSS